MKTLGMIGVTAGAMMMFIGGVLFLGNGVSVIVPAMIGFISLMMGGLALGLERIHDRIDELDTKIQKVDRFLKDQDTASPEQIVDQLRQEGFFGVGKSIDDEDVEKILD